MLRRLLAIAVLVLVANAAAADTDRPSEALGFINDARAARGLAPLRMEARLAVMARDQAQDMLARQSLDSYGPNGLTLEKRLRQAGYAFRQAEQLIAMGDPSEKSVVDEWLQRTNSRQMILNQSLSEVGIGYAHRGTGTIDHFWVITLAAPTRPVASDWRRKTLHYVNQYRARYDLRPLSLNDALNRTAQAHSDDMAARDFFDHVTPNGKTVGDRATRGGYSWSVVLENLAAGQDSPRDVVKGWINSPPHRKALLTDDINDAGIGYTFIAHDGGVVRSFHYWTLNMGRQR